MIIITAGETKSSTVATILQDKTSDSFIQKSPLSTDVRTGIIPKSFVSGNANDVGNYYIKATLKKDGSEVIVGTIAADGNKSVRPFGYSEKQVGLKSSETVTDDALKKVVDELVVAKGGSRIEDLISKRVVKTITNYDSKLGQLVEYPKYNNVALGKDMGGKLEAFGKDIGANVWTDETHNIFTKMYDLPDSWSFERSMASVLNETVGANQGKILFDITGVNIQKSITGGLVHSPKLVIEEKLVTELELQVLLRNESWFNNTIFHEGGKVLAQEELLSKGVKLIK